MPGSTRCLAREGGVILRTPPLKLGSGASVTSSSTDNTITCVCTPLLTPDQAFRRLYSSRALWLPPVPEWAGRHGAGRPSVPTPEGRAVLPMMNRLPPRFLDKCSQTTGRVFQPQWSLFATPHGQAISNILKKLPLPHVAPRLKNYLFFRAWHCSNDVVNYI